MWPLAGTLRRRENLSGEGEGSSSMQRTVSNNSSSSSDILVATPAQSDFWQKVSRKAAPTRKPAAAMARPKTDVAVDGYMTIRFGKEATEKLDRILSKPPNPDAWKKPDFDFTIDDEPAKPPKVTEGPNHRGTYSKQHVLQHPEIEWIHRGQGRYLPASELRPEPIASSPRPTRQANQRTSDAFTSGDDTMDAMLEELTQEFDHFRRISNPSARENWSPSFKHQFNLILDLIKSTPRHNWRKSIGLIKNSEHQKVVLKWIESMEYHYPASASYDETQELRARPSRQAKATTTPAVTSIEQRRSSRRIEAPSNYNEGIDEPESSDESEDPDQTFTREYVDAHPTQEFRHTGNGYYRRGSRTTIMTRPKRRESSNSQALKYSSDEADEAEQDLDEEETVKGDDLHKYPGVIFHHKGNSYYKRGVAPNGRKGTFKVGPHGEKISLDVKNKAAASDSHEVKPRKESIASIDLNATVRREVTEQHPEYEWSHVGGGWFRRKNSTTDFLGAGFTTPAASSERRSSRVSTNFSKDYPESHASDEMTRTSERRKRTSKVEIGQDAESVNGSQTKPKPPLSISRSDSSELFDVNYVNAHPDEVFHHRGQGRWARGLPAPGSSNKIAVRGPIDEADRNDRPMNDKGELAPLPTTLVRRDEGPDKWPQLRWVYRGGGKWCQKTKEEIEADARAALPPPIKKQRTSTGSRSRGDEAGHQLHRESLAASKPSKGKAPASSFLQKPAKIVRKRSQQSTTHGADTSKASSGSQSKAPTPKPPPLPAELDELKDEDLPSFWKDQWSDDDTEDPNDPANQWLRDPKNHFKPIRGWEPIVAALSKYDPASRSLDSLKKLAGNAFAALQDIQNEFLELDRVVARHPIKGNERNPVKGGRVAVSHAIWEDKKESTLYDYTFDPKRVGYQDPDAQKIVRDAEGRELRRRRANRKDIHATQVDYGDGEMTARRTIKPVSRFDGVIIQPPRQRGSRSSNMTPEPNSSLGSTINADGTFIAATRGRWAGHVPKRIRELRGESVSTTTSSASGTPQPGHVRKGRPPGSKNLHKRKDAGIKKGPRKPKVQQAESSERPVDPMSLDAIVS